MRNILGIFLLSCFWLNTISAQLPNTISQVPPKTELVNSIVKVDTREIENLPLGAEIIKRLRNLKYVSQERIVGNDWHLRFELSLDKSRIIVERSGFGVVGSFPIAQKQETSEKVIEIVDKEAKWQAIKYLGNKDSNSKAKIQMRAVPLSANTLEKRKAIEDKSEAKKKKFESGEFSEGDLYQLEITNTGTFPVFVTVINLTPNGSAKVMYSPRSDDDIIPVGQSSILNKNVVFRISKPFGLEFMKVIASTERLDISWGSYIKRVPGSGLEQYLEQLPDSLNTNNVPDGDWATAMLTFQSGTVRTLHVLSVGVNKYEDAALFALRGSENDALEFSRTLREFGRGVFDKVNTKVLIDKDASKEGIIQAFKEIIEQAKSHDAFVFQFSGQSEVAKNKNETIFLPFDYRKPTSNKENGLNAISGFEFHQMLSQVPTKQRFLVLDSCYSTKGSEQFIARIERESKEYEGLIKRDTWVFGSDENARALEDDLPDFETQEIKPYGLMSYSLIAGLRGKADENKDGFITVGELVNFSSIFVQISSSEKLKLWKYGDDFTLAKVKTKEAQSIINFRQPNFISAGFIQTQQQQQTQDEKDKKKVRSDIIYLDRKSAVKERKGKDYALLIATDKYQHWSELKNPIKDAETIAAELKDFYGFEIDLEKDVLRNPTKRQILDALIKRIKTRKYERDDQLFVFFAGHGHFSEQPVKAGYLVAADTQKSEDDPYFETYFEHSKLRQILEELDCQHIFLVVDACFGGTFDEVVARRGGDGDKPKYEDLTNMEFVWRKMQWKSRRYLTSGGKEYVPDGRPGYHSPFASRFIEALRDYGGKNRVLTINGIMSYVERVNPSPMTGQFGTHEPGGDFLFIVKEKEKTQKGDVP